MTTDLILAAYQAARLAEHACLEAIDAADRAGLRVDYGDGDQIVAIERAALAALLAARLLGPGEAAQRDTILASVIAKGDHGGILPV